MNTSFLPAPVPQTFLGSSHFHEPLYSQTGAGQDFTAQEYSTASGAGRGSSEAGPGGEGGVGRRP